jgi:signal transduction histidine kinase
MHSLWAVILLVLVGAGGVSLLLASLLGEAVGHGVASVGGVLVGCLLAGLILHRLVIVRIRRLVRGLREAGNGTGSGDRPPHLSSRWDDEIGTLTTSIDELLATLSHNFEELRTHDELRRRMVANVSHELRTPLTSMQGYLETALGGDVEADEMRRNLEICHQQTKRLARLVQDLFQLSKLDTDQLEFHFETVSLVELADSVGLAFEQRFADKKIEFVSDLPDDSLDVIADGNRLGQVITNLLGNAAVFTPEGGRVTLSCRTQDGRAVCEVADTGIGISVKDQPHIFESFFHLEKSRTRNLGGTGLGLAICKAIIDTHKGEIEVESLEGEGTSFRFTLDLAPSLDEV